MFALTNTTDKPIERWLTADRYDIVGSGVVWPDLDARRIEAVTPSVDYVPERIKNDRADIFRLTLEPGQTVTFVAELSSDRFARLYLWKPIEYEQKTRDRQLFNGIMLGITGLLAIFLTAIFAANHKAIFPTRRARSPGACWPTCASTSASCTSCSTPAGGERATIAPRAKPAWPPASSSSCTCSCGSASGTASCACCSRCGSSRSSRSSPLPFIDPRLAVDVRAHLVPASIAAVGGGFTLFLALRGQDRALSLVPTWMLFLVWLFGDRR